MIMLLIGLTAGLLGSVAGLGGGTIIVPSLLLLEAYVPEFSWVTPQKIVGISLFLMIFTGLSSTITYVKGNRTDVKLGGLLLIGSLPGGIVGSLLNQYIHADAFTLWFGILMLLVTGLFFLPKRQGSKRTRFKWALSRAVTLDGETHEYHVPILLSVVLSFCVGMLSGLFGIGGGSLLVPIMIMFFAIPPHVATATSMFIIFAISIFSSFTHIVLGHVEWLYTLFLIPGAWIGGTLGAKLNQRLNSKSVEWILRVLLVIIGIRLIWDGVR
ncbi:membrane protein [Pontibacillus halophilus JSM 076056 = DSM 19796]|uniref:Probable membrane transporter protein n=1 Tax=Pontibacillus halophilus JSM 076056 = DSM 19796 TaxID=1385510 RepID=A0A0A5GLD1_9BACI|nr:membrane protein [Pontibacillus halophilus JSM 076056 = DSM 19796]